MAITIVNYAAVTAENATDHGTTSNGVWQVGEVFGFGDYPGLLMPGVGVPPEPSGFGTHTLGFGHPYSIETAFITQGNRKQDLGGEACTLHLDVGKLSAADTYTVKVDGVIAYSGISGQGNTCKCTADGSKISFIMPNLYGVSGLVDVQLVPASTPGSPLSYAGMIYVVKHHGKSSSLLIKQRFPSEVYYIPTYRPR